MKKNILILSGGISKERLISLDTGTQVANELKKNGYKIKISEPDENLSKNIRVKRGIGQKLQFISASFQQIKFKWIRSILLSPRHGERGNELSETLYFRAQWWRAMFAENGWKVEEERPSGLFYSGNALFGHALPLQVRRRLSQLLGSSTRLFKVVKLHR